jgi:hypothetical protein
MLMGVIFIVVDDGVLVLLELGAGMDFLESWDGLLEVGSWKVGECGMVAVRVGETGSNTYTFVEERSGSRCW